MISWDQRKNLSNQAKHGVSFELAQLVFDDPLHMSRQDRTERDELRWQTVGMVGGVAILLVAHTWHQTDVGLETIRIISARRATKVERKMYENGA